MFEDLLGISEAKFNAEIRGKNFFVGKSSSPLIHEALTWKDVNELVDTSAYRANRISLAREHERLDRRRYTATSPSSRDGQSARVLPSAVHKAMMEGFSLVIDEVHNYHPPSRRLATWLNNGLGERVTINSYVSWRSDKCFRTHWDDHDVFIIQTAGEKLWSVFEPTREHPVQRDVEYDFDFQDRGLVLRWEGLMRPGDVLYMPRGWWHHASSTGNGSIHLTVGFSNRTTVDLVEYLALLAIREKALRRDLRRPTLADLERPERVAEEVANLRAHLNQLLSDDFLGDFWKWHYRNNAGTYETSNLPLSLSLEQFRAAKCKLQIANAGPFVAIEESGEECSLSLKGMTWVLQKAASPVLKRLASGDIISLPDLADATPDNTLDAEDIARLAFELVNEGIVRIVDGAALSARLSGEGNERIGRKEGKGAEAPLAARPDPVFA